MELGNSVWVPVEPWAAVQLRPLVLVRLVVQTERQLRSALQLLQLLEVVQLVCPLVSHTSVLSNSSSVYRLLGTFRCHHVELFGQHVELFVELFDNMHLARN